MRICHVIQLPYTRPISGADIRNHAIFLALQRVGHVRQFVLDRPESTVSAATFDELLSQIAAENPVLVVIEGVGLLSLAKPLVERLGPSVKIVTDFHNVESNLLAEQDRARVSPLPRQLSAVVFARRWRKAVRADRDAITLSDAIWTCSVRDQHLTNAMVEAPVRTDVIPNPIPDWCEDRAVSPVRPINCDPQLLFVGHLRYPPNTWAVRRLVRQILPPVRLELSNLHLTIAGRAPGRRLCALVEAAPSCTLIPDPENLDGLYRNSDIAVIPLHQGGGSRIKVLEAMAAGCPIIASTKAVEGLALTPGEHYVQADNAKAFSRAIQSLSGDLNRRLELQNAGLKFARSRHGKAAIASAVANAVAAL